jgi:hypothetical protein
MDDSECDKKQVLPDTSQKRSSFISHAPNPARPMRFLMSRRRAARGKSNVAFAQDMDIINEPKSNAPATTYGYLAHIRSLKPKFTPDDKSLPKKVR